MKYSILKLFVPFVSVFINTATFAQTPLISFQFNETSGVAPANTGSLPAMFTRTAGTPASSTSAPMGVGGSGSFDFGTNPGNYYVESTTVPDGLKNLSAFTITGWVNTRSNVTGSGGNRIVSWINNGGDGVDLVYQSNGSLRLGVDGWPDNSPAQSSASKIAVNASAPASNWTFFAVTYQSNGQVQFYFGNNSADATLDVTKSYPAPGVTGSNINRLAIGAFNMGTRNSGTYDRMFRGLIDKIQIHGLVLPPAAIVAVQRGTIPDLTPPTQVTNFAAPSKTATSISLSWTASTDNVGVTGYSIYNGPTLMAQVGAVTSHTLINLTPSTQYSLSIQANDGAGNVSQGSASPLSVTTDAISATQLPVISLKFDEATGVTALANSGTGGGSFVRTTPTPATSTNVPTNVGGPGALDFGIMQGDFYVESGAPIDQLKTLSALTITGWLNNKSTNFGSGGNRIVSWINHGGDGVDLVYQNNGSLRLGVDGWPDNSPAFSSAGKVPTNASGAASNWTFFAVTYQSNGQVQFYFGNNAADATLDVTRSYPGPGVTGSNINRLAIGMFNIGTRNPKTYDRMFRGLIDEIKVYNSVLDLNAIRSVQRASGPADSTPPSIPQRFALTDRNATYASLGWDPSSDNVGVSEYRIYDRETLLTTVPAPATVATLSNITNDQDYALTVRAADAAGNVSEASNIVTIEAIHSEPLLMLRFDEPRAFFHGTPGGQFAGGERSTNTPVRIGAPFSLDGSTSSFGSSSLFSGKQKITITGWLNCQASNAGSFGNPVFTWREGSTSGIDLVYQANGSLRLGINELAANSPAVSNASKVTTDPAAGANNWIFFAATYDATGQVQFFFGNNTADATLDVTRTYTGRGPTATISGGIGIGQYNPSYATAPSTGLNFSGLTDDIYVFDRVLTLAEIVNIQRGPDDTVAPTPPAGVSLVSKDLTSATLQWSDGGTDNVRITSKEVYDGNTFLKSHYYDIRNTNTWTSVKIDGLTPGATYNFNIRNKDAHGNLSAPSNTVVVTLDGGANTPLVYIAMDDNPGNAHISGGSAAVTLVRSAGTPSASSNVPATGATSTSADFGTTIGNYYDESTVPVPSLKNLTSFTLTGWLNNRSNAMGSGGNRIISWINAGGDGVDLVYQSDGSLRLGVDGWPDYSPAFSSSNKVTTNASAPVSNWVFFAVTYQSNGQVQFYFGNNSADATLDVTRAYSGPGVTGSNIGKLAIGAFNDATRNSGTYDRMFRGLIDEIYIYGRVLTPQEIVAIQRGTLGSSNGRMNLAQLPERVTIAEEPALETQMYSNFPNPFSGTTNIEMYIQPTVTSARLQVMDMTGRPMQNIEVHGRGRTSVVVSSDNLNTGVYLYSFVVDGKVVDIQRMAVMK